MKYTIKISAFLLFFILIAESSFCIDGPHKPVTPKASPEAAALLELFYSISGKYTLTGQHNFPNIKDRNTRFAAEYIGKTPVIFSTDWGFAKEDDKDSYLARPEIVKEAIRQYRLGSIITICWHAVPPTAKEPVTFQPVRGANPRNLESVQGQLTDEQFREILTKGTPLYKSWCSQVDSVATYLKKLQNAHVPVLWRPYHEMNGNWFWWGGRTGKYSTRALYRQIYDRLVKYHKLKNLIWVWSVDRPNKPEMQFSNFYPGNDYLDILALDVYGSDFKQEYYDSLVALSKGKPLVLGEVGNPPALDILSKQPKWSYWVIWSGMVRNTLKKQHKILTSDPRILSLEDSAYRTEIAPLRKISGLSPLTEIKVIREPQNFSGTWVFNEEKSILDNFGTGNIPDLITVVHDPGSLTVRKTYHPEDSEDRTTEDILLPGEENKSGSGNYVQTTLMSEKGDTLILDSRVTMKYGDQVFNQAINEKWAIQDRGTELVIKQVSDYFRGKRNLVLVYDKE
jgi:mannan endo-1,4-beta-mannosidase